MNVHVRACFNEQFYNSNVVFSWTTEHYDNWSEVNDNNDKTEVISRQNEYMVELED